MPRPRPPPATRCCCGGGRHPLLLLLLLVVVGATAVDLAAPFCAAVRHTALRPLTAVHNPLCRAFRRLGIEEVQEERPEAAGAKS